MPVPKKPVQSTIIMLTVTVLAIAGFLLVMGCLAASEIPADNTDQRIALTPVTIEPEVEATALDHQIQPPPLLKDVNQPTSAKPPLLEDIIATVKNQIITRQTWQQAARLEATMSQLAAQPILGPEQIRTG